MDLEIKDLNLTEKQIKEELTKLATNLFSVGKLRKITQSKSIRNEMQNRAQRVKDIALPKITQSRDALDKRRRWRELPSRKKEASSKTLKEEIVVFKGKERKTRIPNLALFIGIDFKKHPFKERQKFGAVLFGKRKKGNSKKFLYSTKGATAKALAKALKKVDKKYGTFNKLVLTEFYKEAKRQGY